jgi:signal transduction histidine kinase
MQATIAGQGASVLMHYLPPAWGDATALEQVFANLIGNSLKYLDPKRPGRIEVGVAGQCNNGHLTYYVKDNGIGIPAPYQHKIFQAFQRVHPEAAPGEGMGLAIVRRVVERHHGRVWVESAPEVPEGCIFYVTLPACADGPAGATGQPETVGAEQEKA